MEVGTLISIHGVKGTVRYVGDYHERPGTYVGIELEKPKGKNNGTIKGKKYFDCKENHGLFLGYNDVLSIAKILSEPLAASRSNSDFALAESGGQKLTSSKSDQQFKSVIEKQKQNQKEKNQNGSNNTNSSNGLNSPQPSSAKTDASLPKSTRLSASKHQPSSREAPQTPQAADSQRISSLGSSQQSKMLTSPRPGSQKPSPSNSISSTKQSSARHQSDAGSNKINNPTGKMAVSPAQPTVGSIPRSGNPLNPPKPPLQTNSFDRVSQAIKKASDDSAITTNAEVAPLSAPPKANPPRNVSKPQPVQPLTRSASSATPQPTKTAPQNNGNHSKNENQNIKNKLFIPSLELTLANDGMPPQQSDSPVPGALSKQHLIKSISAENMLTQKNEGTASIMSARQVGKTKDSAGSTSADESLQENYDSSLVPPEIQQEISDLKVKLEGYEKQKKMIRQKLVDIANSYKKSKVETEEKIQRMKQEAQNKLIEARLQCESDISDLEDQILESAERTHRYLEMADEQRSQKLLGVLTQMNEEHSKYEDDLELFLNAQRINVNAATQSIHVLDDRLKRILQKRQENESLISKKKERLANKEKELAQKRPCWQEVTELRTTFTELSKTLTHSKRMSLYKSAEKVGVRKLYRLFSEVHLLDSLYTTLCIERKTQNPDVLHLCELIKLVLGGFVSNTSKSNDLFLSLQTIEESIEESIEKESSEPPSIYGAIAALELVSSIPLDTALTSYYIKSYISKINDEEIKSCLLQLADEVKVTLHPALLEGEQKEEFVALCKNLTDEIKKAEIGGEEEYDVKQFVGKFEKFVTIIIGKDKNVIDEFMKLQLPDKVDLDKLSPELEKKRKERKELEMKAKLLEEEILKEKAKFVALREQLTEPMQLYTEIADQLQLTKTKLSKFQQES